MDRLSGTCDQCGAFIYLSVVKGLQLLSISKIPGTGGLLVHVIELMFDKQKKGPRHTFVGIPFLIEPFIRGRFLNFDTIIKPLFKLD